MIGNDWIKQHWENVYNTKSPEEVSWTQDVPTASLAQINSLGIGKQSRIIDVGGGDSKLVDHLLDLGYENITVLDISGKALERAKLRLGSRAEKVQWIESDITAFKPTVAYDLWHDRAAFHFLTSMDQISSYLALVKHAVSNYMIVGTFSKDGPLKCNGLDIVQYSAESLADTFKDDFDRLSSQYEIHKTPFNTVQNFVFCSFKKKTI